jgi:hypothetical protein
MGSETETVYVLKGMYGTVHVLVDKPKPTNTCIDILDQSPKKDAYLEEVHGNVFHATLMEIYREAFSVFLSGEASSTEDIAEHMFRHGPRLLQNEGTRLMNSKGLRLLHITPEYPEPRCTEITRLLEQVCGRAAPL